MLADARQVEHEGLVDLFPQPGETLSGISTTYRLGGKGANQAAAAAHGGATTLFVGRVGGDASGIALREELREHGVDVCSSDLAGAGAPPVF